MSRKPRIVRPAFGSRAGVTLIEVLIAVTLLSLLTLGMLSAMRIGLITFAKTDQKLMINRRVAGSARILDEELEGLVPATFAHCGEMVLPRPSLPLFQAGPRALRMVSAFSLQQAWRGQPQILDLFVTQSDEGRGMRLLVNETPYSPGSAGVGCLGTLPDQVTGLPSARFAPPQISTRSFVLADGLAYCRFSYLVKARPGAPSQVPQWLPEAPGSGWPLAIRVEMAPLQPNPSQLQPITVTAPIYVHRAPEIDYGDY